MFDHKRKAPIDVEEVVTKILVLHGKGNFENGSDNNFDESQP